MTKTETSLSEGLESLKVNTSDNASFSCQRPNQAAKGAEKKAKRGPRGADIPVTQLSKALSYILRHGTAKEGLKMNDEGRAPTEADVRAVVDGNDKKRFELREEQDGTWLIRAVQGHSIGQITELDHVEITLDNLDVLADGNPPATSLPSATLPDGIEILHGTTKDAWQEILQSGGLNRMKRNHIHLAKGRPGSSSVISGMRASSPLIIHIDIIKALRDGIRFQLASNGAVLTGGQETSGHLPLAYIVKVEESKGGEIIWQSNENQS